jgi:hypothetical protein
MPRTWTGKTGGPLLNLKRDEKSGQYPKWSQATQDMRRKMAILADADLEATLNMLFEDVATLRAERARQISPPMTDAEIAWLERAREGRFNTTNGKAVRACR